MSSAADPRMSGGMVASFVLHGGLVAALIVLRPGARPPSPPMYRVHIVAAPAGERAAGVVRETPAPVPEAPAPTPPSTKPTTAPKTVTKNAKAKPAPTPKLATPAPQTKAAEPPKPNTAAPTAGGGATGGKGADVANVSTSGIEFPYEPYINNITSQIIRRFHAAGRFEASVRFVIHRDGSVDVDGIRIVESSHNYAFDLAARGAVEAAAAAKAFEPLPASFREDVLPVTFRFTPSLYK